MIAEYRYAPFTGLYLPDSSAETPEGSLAKATNVDITDSGAIRQRYGMGLSATVITTIPTYCFVHRDVATSTSQFMVLNAAGTGGRYASGTSRFGTAAAVTGGPTNPSGSAQMLRSPTSSSNAHSYVSSYGNVLYRWDGSTFTSVANSPKCYYLSQGLESERLFAAGFQAGTNGPAGAEANPSRVWASDPGSPEVWDAATYMDFTPGDGEEIVGICTYNNQVFVFKQSKFFVIYGENDIDDTVEFLYHEVSGSGSMRAGAYVSTPVGVFFLDTDGVYLTTGTTPTKISSDINGLFTGELPSWTDYNRFLTPPQNLMPKLTFSRDTLYVMADRTTSLGGEYSTAILAYNWTRRSWTYYTGNVLGLHRFPWDYEEIVVGVTYHGASDYRAMAMHPSLRDDEGVVIPVDVQLNWFRPEAGEGSIGADNVMVARMDAWGLGKAQVGIAVDYQSEPSGYQTFEFAPMATGDVWTNGITDPTDDWGDGNDPADVWSASSTGASDLLRLTAPTQVYGRNFIGRGQYLSVRVTKMATSNFLFIERPRLTLVGR